MSDRSQTALHTVLLYLKCFFLIVLNHLSYRFIILLPLLLFILPLLPLILLFSSSPPPLLPLPLLLSWVAPCLYLLNWMPCKKKEKVKKVLPPHRVGLLDEA